MRSFPINMLKPLPATIVRRGDTCEIRIPLEPFELDGSLVSTELVLDGVCFPSSDPRELGGRTFEFPLNPAEGFIDASVYIDGAHHPVDVRALKFSDDACSITAEGELVLEYEGLSDYGNAPCQLFAAIGRWVPNAV